MGSTCSFPESHILDNGLIRVGIDPQRGGSISYVAPSNDPDFNVINNHDLGRQAQMSFYASPGFYNPPTDEYPNGACDGLFNGQKWPWNPIESGDVDGNPGTILEYEKFSSTQARVLARPKQWACHNVDCECTFEKQVQLVENWSAVHVTATLHNDRTDQYNETERTSAELPAVYTNGFLKRLVSYSGSTPFQNDTLTEYDAGWNETRNFWSPGYFRATEHWAAFVNDDNWGLGVINLAETGFLGGFTGDKSCSVGNSPSGYMTPVGLYRFPRNVTFTFEFHLVLGHLEDIREFATQLHMAAIRSGDGLSAEAHSVSSLEELTALPVSMWPVDK